MFYLCTLVHIILGYIVEIILIVATGLNREIGVDGKLPWSLPKDMAHFRAITTGNAVLMGRNTWLSIPNPPLKGRRNIVISTTMPASSAVYESYKSIEEVLSKLEKDALDKLYIIGGSQIYSQFINIADRIELSLVQSYFPEANAFFPEIDMNIWEVENKEYFTKDEKNIYDIEFISLKRRIKKDK